MKQRTRWRLKALAGVAVAAAVVNLVGGVFFFRPIAEADPWPDPSSLPRWGFSSMWCCR
jgi:hypothetical protein